VGYTWRGQLRLTRGEIYAGNPDVVGADDKARTVFPGLTLLKTKG
jgi:hypothetical protein